MTDYQMTIKQRQQRLQDEYDIICSQLISCASMEHKEGVKEYIWRKHEIENIADSIGIDLLKKRRTTELIKFKEEENKEDEN